MANASSRDPFAKDRPDKVKRVTINGEEIWMLLDWRSVRTAAKDWQTYSSDAPFRVPISSEEAFRSVRQLPIELDPPLHTEIRRQLEPWFRRPADPEYRAELEQLITDQIETLKSTNLNDIVMAFALPLQTKALALLLNMPRSEAKVWQAWGTHVFHQRQEHDPNTPTLDAYICQQIERALAAPGDDFFSALNTMHLGETPLSLEEKQGVANLVFAGGRDTVINMVTSVLVHFAQQPSVFQALAQTPLHLNLAVEELLRVSSPLTHIGRVCPNSAEVNGQSVPSNARVSLCWASANFDEDVFSAAHETDLLRSPNPHVAFGSGVHTCLGALHARTMLRLLISILVKTGTRIEIVDIIPNLEEIGAYRRVAGFKQVTARLF